MRKVGAESCEVVYGPLTSAVQLLLCPLSLPLTSGMGEQDDRYSEFKYAWYIPGVLFKSPDERRDIVKITSSVLTRAQGRIKEP